MNTYQFKELGASAVLTTNIPRQLAAGTVQLVAAPAGTGSGTTNIIVYQIDYDQSGSGQMVIGDNDAVDGTDRIFLNKNGAGMGTVVFPNGLMCRSGKALQAVLTGTTNCWMRVSYMQM